MRCDSARPQLSADFDGEPVNGSRAALEAHVRDCPDCRAYRARLAALRRALRFQTVDELPDVAPPVRRRVAAAGPPLPARWRAARWTTVAAVFVAAAVAGASFVGPTHRPQEQVAAAPLPERVVAAQAALQTMQARVNLVERGWHPQVPLRRFTGHLAYQAPESLAVVLRDRSAYPPGWGDAAPTGVAVVADRDRWWARAPVPCPAVLRPACPAGPPRVETLERREPFSDASPVPLDLVLPARSFTGAATPPSLPPRRLGGRDAVGVTVPLAQVQPLLDGFRQRGDWRAFYPSDRAELWLDADALVPLALRVRPDPSPDRAWWAARNGYDDRVGAVLLDLRLMQVRLNEPLAPGALPPAPPSARPRDAGFADRPVDDPAVRPGWLPPGMRPHRSGVLRGGGPAVAVATWSDGRAWVKVRAVRGWRGRRLFGDLGTVVRRVRVAGLGVAYVGEGGARVAVHARGVDAEVSGSVPPAQLRRVAASLPLRGRPVPGSWAQAAAGSLRAARRALPGLLVPADLAGFGQPAVALRGRAVSLVYTGAGARGFLLTQRPGRHVAPPLEPDVRGVAVRGRSGRYTPALGELEWVEAGRLRSLRSRSLSLGELLAVAEALR